MDFEQFLTTLLETPPVNGTTDTAILEYLRDAYNNKEKLYTEYIPITLKFIKDNEDLDMERKAILHNVMAYLRRGCILMYPS